MVSGSCLYYDRASLSSILFINTVAYINLIMRIQWLLPKQTLSALADDVQEDDANARISKRVVWVCERTTPPRWIDIAFSWLGEGKESAL